MARRAEPGLVELQGILWSACAEADRYGRRWSWAPWTASNGNAFRTSFLRKEILTFEDVARPGTLQNSETRRRSSLTEADLRGFQLESGLSPDRETGKTIASTDWIDCRISLQTILRHALTFRGRRPREQTELNV
jgi:hypothetical protein